MKLWQRSSCGTMGFIAQHLMLGTIMIWLEITSTPIEMPDNKYVRMGPRKTDDHKS